jgi:hypothetical protein
MTDAFESNILAKLSVAIRQFDALSDMPVAMDTRFAEDLCLSRSATIEFARRAGGMFAVDFSQETILRFQAVGDLVRFLSRHFFQDVAEFALAEAA